jgi:hypothetical protein
MSMSSSGSTVNAPPGVVVSPGRETTQVGPTGAGIQGMNFTLTLPSGAMTTVFVPYSTMGYPDQVQALFQTRVDQINGIAALNVPLS